MPDDKKYLWGPASVSQDTAKKGGFAAKKQLIHNWYNKYLWNYSERGKWNSCYKSLIYAKLLSNAFSS